jgi:DNA-binding NarL/FixJ family response regulator
MENIKIAIVEDQRLFREGIYALLKETPGMDIVAVAENGLQFLEILEKGILPDVALVDMNMPELNGFELVEIMVKRFPSVKCIILTVYNQERFIVKMIEAGVAGYLVKNCDFDEVKKAIVSAFKTGFYFNEATIRSMLSAQKHRSSQVRSFANIPIDLTDREIEVLRLICKEHTNSEMAEVLNLSPRTIDGHRNNLLAKVGCKNTAGLVLFAVNNGIYDSNYFD